MSGSSMVSKDRLDFDPAVPEEERRFYQKAYPNVNFVCERKVHCTVCKMHIGTAPSNESIIRMHPILRVTHCKKCHEFYNSGEFSKGEDGSELYCRWCGQGGEVYCCSSCPFVFCKSCIISNLSRGVVADIEQNENWSCFNCAPKMLWPLRAQHWALIRFIDKQKKAIINSSLSDAEIKVQMTKDRSLCCKAKKTTNYASDSSDSSNISLSKLKQKSSEKRSRKSTSKEDISRTSSPSMAKKAKPNDEVVCTPDVLSMLEPECQLTVSSNSKTPSQPVASSPKIMSIPQAIKNTPPPPAVQARPAPIAQVRPQTSTPILKKTVVGPRLPNANSDFTTPVYHTINGYRIDLNSAAQQETVRLPNGKLIQVKRQGTGPQTVTTVQSAPTPTVTPARIIHNNNSVSQPITPVSSLPTQQIVHSSGGHVIRAQLPTPRSITVQNPSIIPQYQQHQTPQQYQQITIRQPNQHIATIRYQGAANQQVTNIIQNGAVQLLNGATVTAVRPMPTLVKQFFPNTPLGFSRTQLQNQICNALDICQHLMGKVQTLTNSNAYKTAKSLVDVKELYIHLSYLLTYAIGRFKGLQDNCLSDMRQLGFTADANSLENGQLAAGMDMVRSGKITDFPCIDLDQFHNLIVQNMNIMITAADSSTTEEQQTIENTGGMEDLSRNDHYREQPQLVEIFDDDEEQANTTGNTYEHVEQEKRYVIEDSDDDCLLVQCGERKSDDEFNSQSNYEIDSDEDDVEEEEGGQSDKEETNNRNTQRSVFSTSYENDDDYRAPFVCGFTFEQDMKLIEFVKNSPELWDPDKRNVNGSVQHQLWETISRQLPGCNCRMRWKNLRYRYLVYKNRMDNRAPGEHITVARHAEYLTFLDKVKLKQVGSVKTNQKVFAQNAEGSLEETTIPRARNTTEAMSPISVKEYRFITKLISAIEKHPTLWHPNSKALQRHAAQPEIWDKVYEELKDEGYKQASDAEEDEISIVEPKTDTITLDSDNEDDSPVQNKSNDNAQQSGMVSDNNPPEKEVVTPDHTVNSGADHITGCNANLAINHPQVTPTDQNEIQLQQEFDFSNMTQFLAGVLEVDLNECGSNSAQVPKKPRKKTTNKPNPTLIKQKEMQERERLENLKKNDAKLKMQVRIPLNKVEDIYEFAKPLIKDLKEKVDNLDIEQVDEKKEVEKTEHVETEEKEEKVEENPIKEKQEEEKDNKLLRKESKSDEEAKDESEDVVVVFVEDFDSPKDEITKNNTEDVDDSVEIIEQERIDDENQSQKGDTIMDSPERGEKDESLDSVGSPNQPLVEKEILIDEDEPINEAQITVELKETLPDRRSSAKEEPIVMDVDTDPLQDDNVADLLVPMESHSTKENIDTSIDDDLSAHSINFEEILARAEVA